MAKGADVRFLTILVAILALLYGGYWFVGSNAVETGAKDMFADMQADGVDVSYASLNTTGFPSRFDTTLRAFSIFDPRSGLGWSAPFFQVFALSYQPNKLIANWADQQTIILPDQSISLISERLRGSASSGLKSELPLDEVIIEAVSAAVSSDQGWDISLQSLLAALRSAGPTPNSYDAYFEASEIKIPSAYVAAIAPAHQLDAPIKAVQIDTHITLDRPLDLRLQTGPPPRLMAINLRNISLDWADMGLRLTGELEADAFGFADGTVTLDARNWPAILELLRSSGVLNEQNLVLAQASLAAISTGEGASATASLPITLENGQMRFGFLPLGPAPRLH